MSRLCLSEQGERLRGLSIGMLAGSLAGNVFCLKSWVELLQVSVSEGSIANWCWEPLAWVGYPPYAWQSIHPAAACVKDIPWAPSNFKPD